MKLLKTLIPFSNQQSITELNDCVQNGTSSHMEEKARSEEAPSPALSHLSVKSDQSMDRPIAFNNETPSYISVRPDEAPSPATSYFSLKSNQSMDRPIAFKDRTQPYSVKRLRPDEAPSPAPSHLSVRSDQSMDRPIAFSNETPSYISVRPDEAPSPATSYFSLKSNRSMDRPIAFKDRTQPYNVKCLRPNETPSSAPSPLSVKSDQSMDRPIAFIKGTPSYTGPDESPSPAPSLLSVKSEQSMDRPIAFRDETQSYRLKSTLSATLLTEDHYKCPVCTEVFRDPVSMPCGHIYCKQCIEIYWSKPTQAGAYACPQCRKRFRDRPVLNVNVALSKLIEELQKAGFSPAFPVHCYAGPEDVACDICTEMKLKAVKTCLTCTASYCETHIRQHYTVPALQRHNLVEATVLMQDSKDTKEIKELDVAFIDESSRDEKIEYSHPTKCFCSGFSSYDLPMDVTKVSALGRPLDIGMLYDQRNESLISDSNLWDNHTLTSDRISWPQLKTHVKVLGDDSLKERCRAFGMSPMLRVSALCGLMELNGAAAFLNHPVQSQYQERVTLHYKTTTRLDMISQRLLQEGVSASVINATTATHVIIAVFYGAQAFFVFDNERINSEKNTEMENVIKKIVTTLSARDVFSSLNETEKANSIFYACSLYSDVGNWKNPMSFDKAMEIYESLPALLGSKDERAVPLKVWLYPLKKLNKSSVCAAPSEHLLQNAENILEHLREQIRVCKDIVTNYNNLSVIIWFPALKEIFQRYSEFLQEYRIEFQRKTAKIIESKYISEEEREKSLQELVSNFDRSPFNPENTHHWFEKKETELAVLKRCRAASITIVKSQEELQRVINDPLMSSVFCFTISSIKADDSFFTALRQYIEFMKKGTLNPSDFIESEDLQQSLKPVYITQKVLSDLEVFITAKETNEDGKRTKFIAASVHDDGYSEYTVQFYHAGRIVSRNLTLQTKPDLLQIFHINCTSVSLKLNQPQTKSIEKYVVEYRALDDDDEMNSTTWKHIIFDVTTLKKTFFISGLKSDHHYQLRYSVIEQDCMSNFSKMINFQTAAAATPGQPIVEKLNRDTLRIFWLKVKTGEDSPVLRYMVEYKEAGLEGWSSVQTQGPECEYILTVPHSTIYRVRVSAVYGEGDISKPSEETPVPVDVWSIDLSERKSSILLEVLKLQTEKKPVKLRDWTDEESEVKGLLQCLPYISQLRFDFYEKKTSVQFLVNLIVSASEFDKTTGENYTELFTSVCSYTSFPFSENYTHHQAVQSEFLLDLCSHVKDYETQTGRSVLPALQPIYQSAPAVWRIKLSERKSSILLDVLKLQTEKKPVELRDWTDEESEVKGFLQCLPYISQLRFYLTSEPGVKFLLKLIVSASEIDANQGETYTELLTSVCSYTSFPFNRNYLDDSDYQTEQCDFLLDLCSHVKDYETQTGRSVLPALQPIYQSAPAVWRIKLSERKSSILLEVLKLQTEKKPVKLRDWTDEESEVKGFLQCLPYISQLRNANRFIPSLCKVFGSKVKSDQVTPLLQALDFTVTLRGKLPSSTCRSVGRVLGLSPSKLNLTLKPKAISVRGTRLLFRHIRHLQKLSLEDKMLVKMVRVLRSCPVLLNTEELSLVTKDSKLNSSHILSRLTSLLSLLSVQCLDLTKCTKSLSLTSLLGLQEPLSIRFSKETLQQLVSVVYEAQDGKLTRCFLKKVSKDLTSCSLTWEVIHYLLQHQALNLKLDFRKSKITCEIRQLLPWLGTIQLKRLSPSFTLSIIMEIYETRFPQYVSGLMSSAGNDISLNGRVLDSVHCAALRFTLQHCNTVKLNLLWTSIPSEELESFLPLLCRVTQLSVDRLLLLKLLHCCSSSDLQQEAADVLLSALHHRLDFSCCSSLDLTDTQENQEHLKLTEEDCRIISSVLQKTPSIVKLILQDCELSEEALKQLWPILPQVQLNCSKALLLQFLACVSKDGSQRGSLRSAEALSQALGGEMDLSHTQMNPRACEQLALFLEYSEGLTELDLSHCKLTDLCVEPLLPHLHKTQTLDLSHNNITDESAKRIHSIVCTHSNLQTVRLFGNKISERKQFTRDKRFEIW
ncbi:uncharacterized protein LOC113058720 isoform X2 [Carassius auratus]|uniref:Uncharacterized protein LOC113058720 isoform X2 n=1 Tax=Carassius auratus TaxID=7957 RepID=A0A6P6LDF9_CARAU|nr:uncharacterized protein LOC113058720 isoform X2 [Carassius auratus]